MDLERSSSSSRTAYLSVKKQSTSTTTTTTTTTNSNSNNIMEDHHDEKRRSNKRCCLVSLAVLIGIALLLSILGATVFKARRPITTVKSVSIQNMDLSFDPLGMKVHLNLSLDADVSVKNPNRVGFKFTDSSAYLNYKGQVVGQAPIPANQIGPGQTLSMNLILTVMADRFLSNSQAVISDLLSGTLPLSTNTRISGKVTVLFVKVHVVSYANCNLNITVASRSLANSDCTYKTRLL